MGAGKTCVIVVGVGKDKHKIGDTAGKYVMLYPVSCVKNRVINGKSSESNAKRTFRFVSFRVSFRKSSRMEYVQFKI